MRYQSQLLEEIPAFMTCSRKVASKAIEGLMDELKKVLVIAQV